MDGNTALTDSARIDLLGGPVAVGKLCEVTPQAVTQWRRDGIPRARRMYLQLLRPELFGAAIDGAEGAPPVPATALHGD